VQALTKQQLKSDCKYTTAMKSYNDGSPKEINNWKVYGLAIVACMAAVMIGYDVSSEISLLSLS
jgi:hypothetical protein